MLNMYGILKFLHVLSVVAWIGGSAGLAVITWRLARERNRVVVAAVVRQTIAYVQRIVGPASGLVLLTGLTMVWTANIGFTTLWVVWGYGGVVVQALIGGFVLRNRAGELSQLAAQPAGDDASLIAAARRLWTAQLVYLTLLASVIAAMILKPTL